MTSSSFPRSLAGEVNNLFDGMKIRNNTDRLSLLASSSRRNVKVASTGAQSCFHPLRVLAALGICITICAAITYCIINREKLIVYLRGEYPDESLILRVAKPELNPFKPQTSATTIAPLNQPKEIKKTLQTNVTIKPTPKEIESGLYRPDTSKSLEHYAGAWLAPRKRFFDSKMRIKAIRSLEGASFSVAGIAAQNDPRVALMTRDYFDFAVQHLSSTTNQLPSGSTNEFLETIVEQTEGIIARLKARAEVPKDHATHVNPLSDDPRRLMLTVALIPFCNRAASVDPRLETATMNAFQRTIRLLFFEATFWSVYRAFSNIVVTVGTDADLKTLLSLKLPIWKTVNMKALFNESAPVRAKGSVHFLPKESLLFLLEKLEDPRAVDFQPFRYIYYTEADHVLQIRNPDQMYNAMDMSGGKYVIAPHRMQVCAAPLTGGTFPSLDLLLLCWLTVIAIVIGVITPSFNTFQPRLIHPSLYNTQQTIAMPKLYPKFLKLWSGNRWQEHLIEGLRTKRIIMEHEDPLGSCCDNGRFYFANCGNWWYNCEHWGLRNFTDWIRFGEYGYTLPLGSEHGARCTYSEARKLCPVPLHCQARVPSRADEICGEVPNVERTFPESSDRKVLTHKPLPKTKPAVNSYNPR